MNGTADERADGDPESEPLGSRLGNIFVYHCFWMPWHAYWVSYRPFPSSSPRLIQYAEEIMLSQHLRSGS